MLKASMIGNIGSDPEMRYSANGNGFLRFSVASNFRKSEGDGTYSETVQWVSVTVAGARAESLQEYLKKGMRVYVDGRLETRPWTDQQGQVQAGLSIFANEVQFFSPLDRGENGGYSQAAHQPARAPAPARPAERGRDPIPTGRTPEQREARARDLLGDDEDENDLPF